MFHRCSSYRCYWLLGISVLLFTAWLLLPPLFLLLAHPCSLGQVCGADSSIQIEEECVSSTVRRMQALPTYTSSITHRNLFLAAVARFFVTARGALLLLLPSPLQHPSLQNSPPPACVASSLSVYLPAVSHAANRRSEAEVSRSSVTAELSWLPFKTCTHAKSLIPVGILPLKSKSSLKKGSLAARRSQAVLPLGSMKRWSFATATPQSTAAFR